MKIATLPTNSPVPLADFKKALFFYVAPKAGALGGLIEAGAYDMRVAGRSINAHVHDRHRWELCFLEKGRQAQLIGHSIVQMKAGDVLLVGPKMRHGVDSLVQEPGRMFFIVLKLPSAHAPFLGMNATTVAPLIQMLLRLNGRLMPLTQNGVILLQAIFADLRIWQDVHAYGKHRLFFAISAQLRIAALLVELVQPSKLHVSQISAWHTRIIKYIEAQSGQTLKLKTIAAYMGLSLSHFKARFQKEIGIAPSDFIRRHRIAMAKKQLQETNTSVTTLALDLGFASSQHFSTVFRHYAGTTPQKYRLQHKTSPV